MDEEQIIQKVIAGISEMLPPLIERVLNRKLQEMYPKVRREILDIVKNNPPVERMAYSFQEAADAIGMSYGFIRDCAIDGRLMAYETGRAEMRITRDDLERFIRGQIRPGDAPRTRVSPERAERRRPARLRAPPDARKAG